MKGRQLVLGDIHGEVEALEEVFEISAFDFDNDRLIQVGDICDRGKSSYEVVEVLKRCKMLILIEGNHDQWLKAYIQNKQRTINEMWFQQGAMATLDSYAKHHVDPSFHASFYSRQLPYFIDEQNNCFVHGGFDPEYKIEDQDMEMLAWDRNLVNQMMGCLPGQKIKTENDFKHIYIGHTPTIYWMEHDKQIGSAKTGKDEKKPITTPITRGGITNIDTGSGKGGKLTIMDVDTKAYWQSELQEER